MLLSLSFSFAQERAVSGNVVDQDNVPLPGVSVVVVGTARGTQTDFDGNYSIRVNSNETLRFTYIGQKSGKEHHLVKLIRQSGMRHRR